MIIVMCIIFDNRAELVWYFRKYWSEVRAISALPLSSVASLSSIIYQMLAQPEKLKRSNVPCTTYYKLHEHLAAAQTV